LSDMANTPEAPHPDWYARRNELESGQVFELRDGSRVKLDRRVPGDGTAWYVADWWDGWSYMDSRIEPSDLAQIVNGGAF